MTTLEIILTGAVIVLSVGVAVLAKHLIKLDKALDTLWEIIIDHRNTLDIHEGYLEANEKWATTMTQITDKFADILGSL